MLEEENMWCSNLSLQSLSGWASCPSFYSEMYHGASFTKINFPYGLDHNNRHVEMSIDADMADSASMQ